MAMLTALLCLLVMPAAAVPYTETELEEYMEAIYCEPVWTEDYPEFWVQFVDVDLDGRKELLSIETGEEYAPKQAHAYAFMDAELSHRGFLTVGKLDVCRDPKTDESFVLNCVEENGKRVYERWSYDPVNMVIVAKTIPEDEALCAESYGYAPLAVTKAQWQTIKVYEDCRALFMPAYQHDDYQNGEPPLYETVDYEESPSSSKTAVWSVAAIVAAAIALATVGFVKFRYIK